MSLFSGLSAGGVPSAHSDVLSATPDNISAQRGLVEEIKRRGRACVGSKDYPNAEQLYSKGIEVLTSILGEGRSNGEDAVVSAKKDVAILLSNRSLVRLQMNKVSEALDDADQAIAQNSSYVKGFWRRGQAGNALGDWSMALESFRRALKLEPTNKALMKEVKTAEQKKAEEEKLMAEAAAIAAEGRSDEKEVMKDKPLVTPTAVIKGESNQKKTTTSATSAAITTDKTDESLFTKSDHVRGYKIRSDGKKTSYFDREIDEETKQMIGDIAPKKIDPSAKETGNGAPKPLDPSTSAWNTAGTWEEKNVTTWAVSTLKAALLAAEYALPEGSPSSGALATVSKVSKLEGHASYATVRGKKRYIYEFSVGIKWTLTLGDGGQCLGEVMFPDVDGTVEPGDGYDIINWSVDPSTPAGTGPLLQRFVRDGGLRDSIHTAIDDWVKLFSATY